MSNFQAIVSGVSTVLIVVAISAAATYSCTQSRTQYYDTYNACISAGGTTVPTTSNSDQHGLACIRK